MRNVTAPQVIITDGFWRKSLSAVRSLGKAGFNVSVMGDSLFTPAFWSNFTSQRIRAPHVTSSPEEFSKALFDQLKKSKESVLLPMAVPTLAWVSENREKLKQHHCHFLVPDENALEIALDKSKTIAKARELKIPYPQSWEPNSIGAFVHKFTSLAPGQYIAKPKSGGSSNGLLYSANESPSEWEKIWQKFGPMLIQERIPSHGNTYGVSLLMDQESQCAAHFVHQGRHQYPVQAGSSTDHYSVHAPELVQMSIRLLKSLKWKGIAMVEWKTDPRDKKTKLMEINPRIWGSMELAVRAGVDFPKIYVETALGKSTPPNTGYLIGVRCRSLIPGDILRYWNQTHFERESLLRFLKGLPTSAEEWDPKDLKGFLATLICTGAQAFKPSLLKLFRKK